MPPRSSLLVLGLSGGLTACGGAPESNLPNRQSDISGSQDTQIATGMHLEERADWTKGKIKKAILGHLPEAYTTACDEQQYQKIVETCAQSPYIEQARIVKKQKAKELKDQLSANEVAICTDSGVVDEDCLEATAYRRLPARFASYIGVKIEGQKAELSCLNGASDALKRSLKDRPIDRSLAGIVKKKYDEQKKAYDKAYAEWLKKKEQIDKKRFDWSQNKAQTDRERNQWEQNKMQLEADKAAYPKNKEDWLRRKNQTAQAEAKYKVDYAAWAKRKAEFYAEQERAIAQQNYVYRNGHRPIWVEPSRFPEDPPLWVPSFNEPEPIPPLDKLGPKPAEVSPLQIEAFESEPVAPALPEIPLECSNEGRFTGKPYKLSPMVEDLASPRPELLRAGAPPKNLPSTIERDTSHDKVLASAIIGTKKIAARLKKLGPEHPIVIKVKTDPVVVEATKALDQSWNEVLVPFTEGALERCYSAVQGSLDVGCIERMQAAQKVPGYDSLLKKRVDYTDLVRRFLDQ